MPFKRSDEAKLNTKPDKRGKVIVRVILQDPRAGDIMHTSSNLRKDFAIEDSTVGEVAAAIEKALFGGNE